jgi:hypothetical protein
MSDRDRSRSRSRERAPSAPEGDSEAGKLFIGNLSFDVRILILDGKNEKIKIKKTPECAFK